MARALVATLLVWLALTTAVARGATFFINAASGNDSHDCSNPTDQVCASLERVWTLLNTQGGDTISVAGGYYTGERNQDLFWSKKEKGETRETGKGVEPTT